MLFQRHPSNPLLTPRHIRPSQTDYEVIGVFNAGVTRYNGETLLLLRVAERPQGTTPDWIACPYVNGDGGLSVLRVRRDDPLYDTADPRFVRQRRSGAVYLTSISHLRLARSADGVHFVVEERPWLSPRTADEAFGVEDARITALEGRYYVNYSAVSPNGIATALASTADFTTVARHDIIFPPSNRDVVIFPQKVQGLYFCYHRPMPGELGRYSIWSATSPDLKHWGNHRLVLAGSADGWDAGRVGGGAPPIWTEAGWLVIYHAADRAQRYCLGAFLAAHDDPACVLYRSRQPILEPQQPYERKGFFPNVVFTCGVVVEGDRLQVYYGASDDVIALAEASLAEVCDYVRGGAGH